MALVSELPLFGLAMEAEKKHGVDTHMAIEVVLKDVPDDDEIDPGEVEEEHVMWWVEFENDVKVFDNFEMVRHYLLEEAVKTGNGPEVIIESELTDYVTEE